jgi:hypothetical protein
MIQLGEIVYNIVIDFGIDMQLVRLIKIGLTERCSRSQVGNNCLVFFLLK